MNMTRASGKKAAQACEEMEAMVFCIPIPSLTGRQLASSLTLEHEQPSLYIFAASSFNQLPSK